ncbi:hypothetical protein SAMN05444682_114167 [Parapedobacter indicus]|uniref:Uncharacterized protein n=1 Tax=Parapedobacter indicus TaxID=1477437 RepID=A0A1I3UHJ4_9SPHI|nr:hypothetical protein CLV26_114167 [Parapedobacter indicus]SFJ82530.1 hypothetical protein SAMN05444682_114167 [Parapedobacter indicus]
MIWKEIKQQIEKEYNNCNRGLSSLKTKVKRIRQH